MTPHRDADAPGDVGRRPRALSLFSGIGAGDLGLERAGFEIVAQAENDPFCNKVLAKHWPEVMRFGDVRDISLESWAGASAATGQHDSSELRPQPSRRGQLVSDGYRPLGLIIGGFPCQDLSVAGKRAGLDGERSGLWFEFHRILSELRPTFCLVENVPGLLSSNGGRDFAVILNGLGELGYVCGWAVLDSQHFGVPQRRRRVYIVGGPTRASVQQILSICEGGDWHPAKGRTAGEGVAVGPLTRASSVGGTSTQQDVAAGHLVANTLPGHHPRHDLDNDTYIAHQVQTKHRSDYETETAYTLDGANGQAVAQPLRSNRWGGSDSHGDEGNAVLQGSTVRRLTPVECERLQGLPDGWTQLDDKTPDGPRYKGLGNAMTQNVIFYLGCRIKEVLNGSLPH